MTADLSDAPASDSDDHGRDGNVRHDAALERAVLGSLMVSPAVRDAVLETGLTGKDFYRPANEQVWDAIDALAERGERFDPLSVAAELSSRGTLARVGGHAYLHTLVAEVTSAWAAPAHARRVAADCVFRRLTAAGMKVQQLAATMSRDDVDEALEGAQAAVAEVADRRHVGDVDSLDPAIDEALDELENGLSPAVPTGIDDLDEMMAGGLRAKTITTIGARPSVGKTIVGLQVALNVALATGKPVGFTSLEMARPDLLYRAIACLEGLDYQRLLKSPGEPLTESEWRAVARGMERLRASGLYIPDAAHATVASIRADIRKIQRTRGECALWVVDYLQLVTPSDPRVIREQQVAGIMRSLKQTTMRLGTPLLLLSQLSRDGEKTGREPAITDLRESGSIEQDSDNVVLLHRNMNPDGEVPKDGLAPDEIKFLVPKNRRGVRGSFIRLFEGHHQRVGGRQWRPSHAGLNSQSGQGGHWTQRGES